jgi:hypothetical protein
MILYIGTDSRVERFTLYLGVGNERGDNTLPILCDKLIIS